MGTEVAFPQFVRNLIDEQIEKIKKPCCRTALVYGFLRFSKKGELPPALATMYRGQTKGRVDTLLLEAGLPVTELRKCSHCLPYLLMGIYLACGRVSVPAEGDMGVVSGDRKGYHFEWTVGTGERERALCALLEYAGVTAMPLRSVRARDGAILYYKKSLLIEEIFYRMELNRAGYRISDLRLQRGINNDVNRRMNFDAVNIRKSLASAGAQVEAVEYLSARNLLSGLPESLQETAQLRLAYPSASLQELMELHNESLTRSGVNHRLAKLVAAANAHKERNKKNQT